MPKKTVNVNLLPEWKQWAQVLWCAVFHRKHHIRNAELKQRFCKKCDPRAVQKATRAHNAYKWKSPAAKRKIRKALESE